MASTQQQHDDLLESLIAFTHGIPAEQQAALLARLVLVLAAKLDDAPAVEAAIAQVAQQAGHPLERSLP
ncbi:DUF2783 domain-containing protein [Variovorax sp. dw_954]|uniref:DUF2783 domain-containing protein n=1 Tax=Variovorax sp. dw_954 TaxID=2720078 RepID=UPI001BD53F97|nr:DUF2783 domain-containing protein [Variovorax sp. dw_954]